MTQTAIQIGNSVGFTYPAAYARKFGIKKGTPLEITHDEELGVTTIRVLPKKRTVRKSDAEYEAWYKKFIDENGEILDELAVR